MTPETLKLSAVRRDTVGRTPEQVRRAGYIPAVLYGHGVETRTVAVEKKPFGKLLSHVSSSTLLDLILEGATDALKVLLHEIQHHPLTGEPVHIDFYQVKLTEKINANVPLVFEGVSLAVKDLAGTLVKSLDGVEVEALPQDLPEHLVVDIAKLATFEDQILVKDLPIPTGVEVLDDAEDVVAVVTPPRSEAELEELETTVEDKSGDVKTEADEKKAEKEAAAAEEGKTENT